MATPEFEETGATSNQVLYRLGATKAPKPPGGGVPDEPATRFAKSLLEGTGGVLDLVRQMRANPVAPGMPTGQQQEQPKGPFDGFSRQQIVSVYDRVSRNAHKLTPEEATELEQAIAELR